MAIPLADLWRVDGTHYTKNYSYTHSTISLRFPKSARHFTLYNKTTAENLAGFLQTLIVFRQSDDPGVRLWAANMPGRMGAVALRLTMRGPNADLSDLPETANPPVPNQVAPDPSAPKFRWRGELFAFLVSMAAGIGCFFAFPYLNNFLQDEYLFAQIPGSNSTMYNSVEEIKHYLAAFPHGRHEAAAREMLDERLFAQIPDNDSTEAVKRYLSTVPQGKHVAVAKEMLDDRTFKQAKTKAEKEKSPAALRDYLVDHDNQRHRPEAQAMIGEFYDAAIQDVRAKRAKLGTQGDAELFAGVLALLEALKRTDRPSVTVGLRAKLDRIPVTKAQKELEEKVYELYLKEHPELKTIAAISSNGSAIISADQAFEPPALVHLERVILERLRDAVGKGINADIMTLELLLRDEHTVMEVPAQVPVIEVAYHIFAGGELGTYTAENKRLVGLLRWYDIGWTITIRPPGTDQTFVFKLQSQPGEKITYDREQGDPSWAIYAVLLYSGFYDMSARMIRNFGLDPGPIPNAFSFAAATRTARDEPNLPFTPNPFLPKPDPFPWKLPDK
jgi:hypothetical protein